MAPILGALFAILVGILAIRPYLDYQQRSFENIKVANTASQFRQILNATQDYIESAGSPTPGPIALSQLSAYLPPNVLQFNPYGQQWNILLSNTSSGMQALVYSSGGTTIPERLAPEIAAETGAAGGFVPYAGQYNSNMTPTVALGAYGYWSLPLASYNINPGAGHLVGVLTFNASGSANDPGGVADNDYLYRVPVPGDKGASLNTMQTNLNMGTVNSITNAKSVSANSSVGVSPSATTPYLSDIAVTTDSSGNPEGEVQTANQAGTNTTIMESDSQQSSAEVGAVSSASGKNSVDMQANSTQASLSLANSNASTSLTLISTPQTVGAACDASQVGTIAPNSDGSGRPLVCMIQSGAIQSLSVSSVLNKKNAYPITAVFTAPQSNGSNQDFWQFMGSSQNFLQSQNIGSFKSGPGFFYLNSTSKPLFLSSDCNSSAAGVLISNLNASITFTLQGPSSYSNSDNQVGLSGVSILQVFSAAPASSVIVPPGYTFSYTTTGVGDCSIMVTY